MIRVEGGSNRLIVLTLFKKIELEMAFFAIHFSIGILVFCSAVPNPLVDCFLHFYFLPFKHFD